jgi:hypothetical protein
MQDIMSTLHKPQMKRRHKRKSPAALAAHTKYENTYKIKNTEQSKFEDNPDLCYLNPRFNFKDALADINKRLTSQSSFWISLWKDLWLSRLRLSKIIWCGVILIQLRVLKTL